MIASILTMAWIARAKPTPPMSLRPCALPPLLLLLGALGATALGVSACADEAGNPRVTPPPGAIRCDPGTDADNDLIDDRDERTGDADEDGRPNRDDTDADGDGHSDLDEAGDIDCSTPPVDTDGDGLPDFLDRDANGDGTDDAGQIRDTDGDGIVDWRDLDVDGDGIPNFEEVGDVTDPVDTDSDGTPDVFDADSDGDTIADANEGRLDADGDGVPNFRDLDSDEDGIPDASEAGDDDLATAPRACARELDSDGEENGDGLADYTDADSDNDGLGDGQELELGTDPCDPDSDGDGVDDLAEGAYERVNCPDGESGIDCGCATDAGCAIPPEHFYVVLPQGGEPVTRELEFGTAIQAADVFFLVDTTGSMRGTLDNVQRTVGRAGTGLIDRIITIIPDAWFGGGQHDDFPFSPYGGGEDEPFILAIGVTPHTLSGMGAGSGRDAVGAALGRMTLHNGGDDPEAQTEALHQIVTGMGGGWADGSMRAYAMRRWEGDCLGTGWGAACFRSDALPIIVHFSDVCAHEGPPGESGSCSSYSGVTPAPASWSDMVDALRARSARYVGVNTSTLSCAGVTGGAGTSPCWFMQRTAEATDAVDRDGAPFVYDLPDASATAVFGDTIVGAITDLATRVRLDVDTVVRDDPDDPEGVDATRFVHARVPSCLSDPPRQCVVPLGGVDPAEAVEVIDVDGFEGVMPGTRVRFEVTFQNDFLPGAPAARVFVAFIDVRGDGVAVLDTRQVFVVVPAASAPTVI